MSGMHPEPVSTALLSHPQRRTVLDLTWPIGPELSVAPEYPAVRFDLVSSLAEGDSATAELITTGIHVGTHVDAPAHFFSDGETVDAMEPLALCGSAVVVDVDYAGEGWQEITRADFDRWERRTGESIAKNDVVLVRSGYGPIWQQLAAGPRTQDSGWPFFGVEALELLLERQIKLLGTDAPDPDRREPSTNTGHQMLLAAGIYIIENLANLESIPVARFDFLALALPFTAGSGSPVRALALIERAPSR